MLQSVSYAHVHHHVQSTSSTIASITASLQDTKTHLLLAASGSVATIKLPNIIQALSACQNLSIRVLLTPAASRFLTGQTAEQPSLSSLRHLPHVDGVYVDEDEWKEPWKRGNAILHIELRRWADMLVIAPLSANTMAKIVAGMADGILTSVVRAWDARRELDSDVSRAAAISEGSAFNGSAGARKKRLIIVAPAMNTAMWRHPVTVKQIKILEEEWGARNGGDGWFEVLRPQKKTLACGDIGDGAMEWTEIVGVIRERLGLN